jgi:RNA polymerase sigma-70 factor (ECF subfamily)
MTAPVDLAAIYEAEVDYVWRSLRRLGVGERDLEDVTHEVFLAVHRHLAAYDPARPLRPWLFGFAHRAASDYRRSARVTREVVQATPRATAGGPSTEEQAAVNEARAVVLAALDTLSEDARALLVLHDFEGHGMPDIATALGAPLNTLYSRLRLARARFTAALQRRRAPRGTP